MLFPMLKQTRAPLSQDDAGKLIALVAILFGGWLRLMPPAFAGFPINDGGLFYVMTQAIQDNSFRLPSYVSYNGLDIPFAYPPLAFYVTAALGKALNVPLMTFFQWLPAVVLIGTILAFHLLAKHVFRSGLEAGIATLIFALMPRSVTWFIMGGGLTRSFGLLFLILAALYIYRAFSNRGTKDIFLAALFSTLVVLSHPEAALHTIAIGLLFLSLKGRDRRGLIIATVIGLAVMLLSAIWWVPNVLRFGLAPILSAGQTGLNETFGLLYPFVQFSEEPYITFIMVFAFIGIAIKLIQRDYLLPAWYLLPFLVEMRSARNVAIVPLALLSTIGFMEIARLLANTESQFVKTELRPPLRSRATLVLLIALMMYWTIGMQLNGMTLATQTVTPSNRAAFEWIAANTPPSSRFLVITGETELLRDWTQEWFPALTRRRSETTIQGYEWLGSKGFLDRMIAFQRTQQCAISRSPLPCIQGVSSEYRLDYEYIYVAERTSPLSSQVGVHYLFSELSNSAEYELIYRTEDAAIFRLSVE